MKPHALFSTPLIVATAVLSTACGDVIEVDVLRPAEVEVGTHIQRVMVIDRAAPKNFGEELLAGVEGLTTAEGLLADKEARGVIIDEVIAILEESPRFDVVYAYPSKYEINSTIWDTSLDRWEVMNLCDQYGCDGIISLEAIDSDSDIFDLTEVITSE